MSEVIYNLDGVVYRESDGVSLLLEAAARVCGSNVLLARRLGVSRSAVQQWIGGLLTPSKKRICEMLEIVSGADGASAEKQTF